MIDFLEDILMPMASLALAVLLFALVIVVPLVAIFGGQTKQQEMYQHCIDDGNKDYVCYQMTHNQTGTQYVPMPMPIPMRVK